MQLENTAVQEKPNGVAHVEPSVYKFNEGELAFFRPRVNQINSLVAVMSEHLTLICAQRGLPGAWRMLPDGSGIEQA